MKPVTFNFKAIQDAQARIAQALARPDSERRRPLTQAEIDEATKLTPIQEAFNNQQMDHVAE